jgi:hypothetical protein
LTGNGTTRTTCLASVSGRTERPRRAAGVPAKEAFTSSGAVWLRPPEIRRRRAVGSTTRAVATGAGGGAMAPQGGDGSGILGWLSRQFVNQLKAIPLLRWPRHGFFSPKTWTTTLKDAIIVMFSLVFFVLVLGLADYVALKIFKILTLGKA